MKTLKLKFWTGVSYAARKASYLALRVSLWAHPEATGVLLVAAFGDPNDVIVRAADSILALRDEQQENLAV